MKFLFNHFFQSFAEFIATWFGCVRMEANFDCGFGGEIILKMFKFFGFLLNSFPTLPWQTPQTDVDQNQREHPLI